MFLELTSETGAQTLFYALVLSAARIMGFIVANPIFSRMGVQAGVVRGGIIVVLSAPVFVALYGDMLGEVVPGNFQMIGLIGKEILVGLLLALILGVPFWAAAAAGDMVDLQRGASMASLVDPNTGEENTPTGTLFFLFALFLFATQEWFRDIFLDTLYSSYEVWPVMRPLPELSLQATELVLGLLASVMMIGLVLALPIIASLLLAELSMAIAGRYLPQLNIMLLALSAKQVIYVILLPIYFVSLIYFQEQVFETLGATLSLLTEMFTGEGSQ